MNPPKPTAIRLLEGNLGRRPLPQHEPDPLPVRPEMPAHLDERAQKEWNRLCPMLERMRVLTEADGIALGNLCADYSILIEAQKALQKSGLLAKSGKEGMIRQSPLLRIISETTDRVTRSLREFGLTPSSRTRVAAEQAAAPGKSIEDSLCEGRSA